MIFARGFSLKDNIEIADKDLEVVFDFLDSYDEHNLEVLNYQNGELFISIQQSANNVVGISHYANQDIYRGPKPINGGDHYVESNFDSTQQNYQEETNQTPPKVLINTSVLTIHATMSGSFYSSKEQGSDPLIKVGDRVTIGQSVCLLEAMKLFTEVKSGVSGVIEKIYAKDGDLVTEGDVLFDVQP